MLAEIITIGDEILIGQIIDTNSAFISKQLNKIGISVFQITSVQDDKNHILKALEEAEHNADVIIITGGLGPTKDDITKRTISEYFHDTLIQDEAVLENIKTLWKNYIKKPLAQVNIDQALVPSKAKVLMNYYGSAPGMWMEKGKKTFISLPGVPFEMKALVENELLPKLKGKYELPFILHKTLLVYGVGESALAERIADWEDDLPAFIKLAYLPSLGRVRLRLSAKGSNKDEVEQAVNQQIGKVMPLIEEEFVGFEDHEMSLEAVIGKQLSDLGQTLATAESCTGGKIAEQVTALSGASNYFRGSVIAYATETKTSVLQIPEFLPERVDLAVPLDLRTLRLFAYLLDYKRLWMMVVITPFHPLRFSCIDLKLLPGNGLSITSLDCVNLVKYFQPWRILSYPFSSVNKIARA